jgi:hypothetical protein
VGQERIDYEATQHAAESGCDAVVMAPNHVFLPDETPPEAYEIGDVFMVQHGPNIPNVFAWRIIGTDPLQSEHIVDAAEREALRPHIERFVQRHKLATSENLEMEVIKAMADQENHFTAPPGITLTVEVLQDLEQRSRARASEAEARVRDLEIALQFAREDENEACANICESLRAGRPQAAKGALNDAARWIRERRKRC